MATGPLSRILSIQNRYHNKPSAQPLDKDKSTVYIRLYALRGEVRACTQMHTIHSSSNSRVQPQESITQGGEKSCSLAFIIFLC